MVTGVSDFITSKRRKSYLTHASCPMAESVKRDLLIAPGSETFLFNQPLLEKVVTSFKEGSILSSTASLASLSIAAARRRYGASGSGRSSSSLGFSRPGPSGYRKRSASPARLATAKYHVVVIHGSSNKRGRKGRGMTPSSSRGKGFRR